MHPITVIEKTRSRVKHRNNKKWGKEKAFVRESLPGRRREKRRKTVSSIKRVGERERANDWIGWRARSFEHKNNISQGVVQEWNQVRHKREARKSDFKKLFAVDGGRYEEGAGTTRLGIFSLGHLHDEAVQRVWRTRKAPIEMNQGLVSRLHRFSPSTKAWITKMPRRKIAKWSEKFWYLPPAQISGFRSFVCLFSFRFFFARLLSSPWDGNR